MPNVRWRGTTSGRCSASGAESSSSTQVSGGGPSGEVSDFLLEDVNDTSATYQQGVSPRDHLGRISAWFFSQAG